MTSLTQRAAPIFLALCLILGGASAAGFTANLVLELMGLLIGVIAVIAAPPPDKPRTDPFLPWLALLLAAIVCMQFIPLPQVVWMALPGRAQIAGELALLGVVPRPAMLTLSYHESVASLVWLLPAGGMLLALVFMREIPARSLAFVTVGTAMLGILLGTLQYFGGQDPPPISTITPRAGRWSAFSPTPTIWRRCCWQACPSFLPSPSRSSCSSRVSGAS